MSASGLYDNKKESNLSRETTEKSEHAVGVFRFFCGFFYLNTG